MIRKFAAKIQVSWGKAEHFVFHPLVFATLSAFCGAAAVTRRPPYGFLFCLFCFLYAFMILALYRRDLSKQAQVLGEEIRVGEIEAARVRMDATRARITARYPNITLTEEIVTDTSLIAVRRRIEIAERNLRFLEHCLIRHGHGHRHLPVLHPRTPTDYDTNPKVYRHGL